MGHHLLRGCHAGIIAGIRNAGPTQVRVREAVDVVGVVIAGRSVPVVDACVGRELHHPEQQRRSRECVTVPTRADERIDPTCKIARLRKNRRQKAGSNRRDAEKRILTEKCMLTVLPSAFCLLPFAFCLLICQYTNSPPPACLKPCPLIPHRKRNAASPPRWL